LVGGRSDPWDISQQRALSFAYPDSHPHDIAQAQDAFKHARSMEKKYLTLIQQQMEEGGDP
jgi:hypothetical protein